MGERGRALAGMPSTGNLGPLPNTQIASSASQQSCPASCLSLLLQPLSRGHKDKADTQLWSAHPLERRRLRHGTTSPKPFGGGPCPKGCGSPHSLVLAAPGSALLLPGRTLLGAAFGSPCLIHSLPCYPAVHRACPPDSASMISR